MTSYADYLFIISPPDSLAKEIDRYKRASANVIGNFEGRHSRAHITITYQTRCKPFLVEPAIQRMQKNLRSIPPVELQIKRFNYFTHGASARTIYAEIEITPAVERWFKLMIQQLGIKIKRFVPHITVARNIPVTAFNKLWPNFANRSFEHTFKVNSITILHRETFAEYCEWRVYKELRFENKLMPAF
jgi:2'-5' RNA ligase